MYRLSKARVPGLCLVALMALFARSVSAVTASQEAVRDETCQQLEQRLDAGQAPSVVITTLTESGMSRADATVFAMLCIGKEYQATIAAAGVHGAADLVEVRAVAEAVFAAAGASSLAVEAARTELGRKERLARQPSVYQGEYELGGGGVSPST